MKRATEFLENISGRVGLFFHEDCDGVCSAAIILSLLKRKNIKPSLFCGNNDEETFKRFGKKNVDAAIFLDFPVDSYIEFLKHFKNKKVLIIDHHPICSDLNKYGFVHINPRFEKQVYKSASEVCYELFCNNDRLSGCLWLARLGGIGDKSLVGTKEEAAAVEAINAVDAIEKERGLVKLARFLSNCKLEDFLYSEKYQRLKRLFEKEMEKQIEKFLSAAESDDVIFFNVKSRYRINSLVANALFDLYPDKTIITFKRFGSRYKVSGRSSKIDIGSAFKKASFGIGRGGGHERAGGADVKIKDFGKFRKRIIEMIDKNKN